MTSITPLVVACTDASPRQSILMPSNAAFAGILNKLLEQGHHIGMLVEGDMVGFRRGEQQFINYRRKQAAKQSPLAIVKTLHQLR